MAVHEELLEHARSLAPVGQALSPGVPGPGSRLDRWIVSRLETASRWEDLEGDLRRYRALGGEDPRVPAHLRARLEARLAGEAPRPEWIDRQAEGEAGLLWEALEALEELRDRLGLAPEEELDLLVQTPSFSSHRVLDESSEVFLRLARARLRAVRSWMEEPPSGSVCWRVQDLDLYVVLPSSLDLEGCRARLRAREEGAEGRPDRARLRLLGTMVQDILEARGRT